LNDNCYPFTPNYLRIEAADKIAYLASLLRVARLKHRAEDLHTAWVELPGAAWQMIRIVGVFRLALSRAAPSGRAQDDRGREHGAAQINPCHATNPQGLKARSFLELITADINVCSTP